jgi:hypothetical protein
MRGAFFFDRARLLASIELEMLRRVFASSLSAAARFNA